MGVAGFLKQGLLEAGFVVDVANDGLDGLEYALAYEYDVILLDIMLPKLNGLHLLREVRERQVKTPILLLTARDALDDRVQGLDLGADDYLTKPFAFPELLARIRALLRRPPLQTGNLLTMDDLVMDIVQRKVQRAGKIIDLSPREFSLLELLLRHPNQVLTRTQMLEHVWSFDFYNDTNVVDVYIGYLRRKIDREFSKPLIQTIRGIGYRLSEVADE